MKAIYTSWLATGSQRSTKPRDAPGSSIFSWFNLLRGAGWQDGHALFAVARGDNLMVHAVMEQVQPGEILILTMPEPEPVALIGELLATQALVRQVAGILVDASVRDTEELQALGLPIWTRWIRVRGATKTHVGTINEPVTVGGTHIAAGDLVVLDADGAVAIAAARASAILEASRARVRSETTLRAQLQAGALSYDLSGLRAVVEGSTQS